MESDEAQNLEIDTYELKPASTEQLQCISHLENSNIVVDSIAGSGKTTLCMHIGKYFHDKHILLFTYNSKLKLETRQKVERLGIQHMEVHSYHSFCVKYYHRQCFTDSEMIKLLKKNKNEIRPFRPYRYDIIILDEVQDMNPIYYELVQLVFYHNQYPQLKLCVVGDKNQSIFQFNKADKRYILYSHFVFPNQYEWNQNKLSESFRITHQMAQSINECFLKYPRLASQKQGVLPKYCICDSFGEGFDSYNRIYQQVIQYLSIRDKESGLLQYKYEDIFILAPSVKSDKTPCRILANLLSKEGIPIYVPVSDESKLDEDILMGKIVFSTFHQVKGLERKITFVYNMDSSYFEFYNKDANPFECPNEIYVACTRASEHLILIHHYQHDYLPFIDKNKISQYFQFQKDRIQTYKKKVKKNYQTNVTDLTKHLSLSILEQCFQYFEIQTISEPTTKINIPLKTKQKNLYESVSEITGIAIPNYFEFIKKNTMSIYHRCKDELIQKERDSQHSKKTKSFFSDDIEEDTQNMESEQKEESDIQKLEEIDFTNIKPSDILYIANLWNSYKTNYIFKVNQIKKYDWLPQDSLDLSISRLEPLISNQCCMEQQIVLEDFSELYNRKLVGHIDCIDRNHIWELKCVSKLDTEHILQIAIYMYMFLKQKQIEQHSIFIPLSEHSNSSSSSILQQIEEIQQKLQFCEVIRNQILEEDYKENDIIDFIYNENTFHEWTIYKLYKTNSLVHLISKDKKRKVKISKTQITKNHTQIQKCKNIREKEEILQIQYIQLQESLSQNDTNHNEDDNYHFYLFNILDGHHIEIISSLDRLENMIQFLIYQKYFYKNHMTDEDFLLMNQHIREKYI